MHKVKFFVKRIVKTALWTTAIILLLLFSLAALIRIPSVQNILVKKATSYISGKTKSEVRINKILLSFPTAVSLRGVVFKDLAKDTLLSASEIEIGLNMYRLLHKEVTLNKIYLKDVVSKISREENDTTYNFDFIIRAFAQPKNKKESKTSSAKLEVKEIEAINVRFELKDKEMGITTAHKFTQLSISMDEIDIDNLVFNADQLTITGLHSSVEIFKHPETNPVTSKKSIKLPIASAKKITMAKSDFRFRDHTINQSLFTYINEVKLENSKININTEQITNEKITLNGSVVKINMNRVAKEHPQSVPNKLQDELKTGWVIHSHNVEVKNTRLGYNITNVPQKEKGFDANHINYNNISFKGSDLLYSADKTSGNVERFSANDSLRFAVKHFSTQFLMTPNLIKADKINLRTQSSLVMADAEIRFSSLSEIGDSLQNLLIKTTIKKSKIYPFEILYFSPDLIKLEYFKNNSPTFLSGIITGQLKDLTLSNLSVNTEYSTYLKTNLTIKGLPNFKTAFFNVRQLDLSSGRSDITKLAGKENIPSGIVLPEKLQLTGTFKGFLKEFSTDFALNSSFGNFALSGRIDKQENFSGTVQTKKFDLGHFLNKQKLFGPLTLDAKITGHGLDTQTVKANISANIPEIYLNQYNYHNLSIDGTFSKKLLQGKVILNDSNAKFNLNAYVNLEKGKEQYNINLNLEGADLKKLNLVKQDIRLACSAVVDIKGKDMNSVNGTAGVTKIIISSKGKTYALDSLMFAAINKDNNSEMHMSSSIVGLNYKGTFAPGDLVKEIKYNLNTYFPMDQEPVKQISLKGVQQFSFEILINNHPILSEVFLPELKEFEPGLISGSFNSEQKQLTLNASIHKLTYGTIQLDSFAFQSSSNQSQLSYKLTGNKLSNSKIKFDNILVDGKLKDKQAYTLVSSTDLNGNKKLLLNTVVSRDDANYKLFIDPAEFYLMNEKWEISQNNFLSIGKKGILTNNLKLTKNSTEISVNTPDKNYDGDIQTTFKNFNLEDFSRIIEKDTAIVKGIMNGELTLKKVKGAYGFVTDLSIDNFNVRNIELGRLLVKANNNEPKKFNIDVNLTGAGNDLKVSGYFIPDTASPKIDMVLNLKPLTMKTLEAFSFGQITESSGNLSGDFSVKGNPAFPEVTGILNFEEVRATPQINKSPLYIKSEKLAIKPGGVHFDSFTILDKNENTALINGNVTIKSITDIKFGLTVNTNNFLLLNTTAADNEQYYGNMIVDSRIRVRGTHNLPVISSSVKIKNGSHFTFAVTESRLTTDKGEGVVLFIDSTKLNKILTRNQIKEKKKTTIRNFDISSTIEIDKKATIRLMLDPGSSDSLVVRGDAALSFGLDPSGKTSLTGVYNLTEGSYAVSLENLVKKKFKIQPGSTITWNGDPLDAIINLNAIYNIRTSPIDLVAGQVTGTELAAYRQRYPFNVYLKLKGPILTPDISFEIQLQAGDKGAANGSVNAKLEQLNDNPSALNKQVFALLVLNRFIQENPLQTETDATVNAARTTVGKFLSSQLNALSSKFVPGVDINFDIQSYDDYSTGKAEGRTQVEVGVSKQLFNERLSVQVGGAVDVEGEKAQQNNASDVTGDIIVEYKITPNGRYRVKGFRNNQYQGALEGQLIQTGAGLIYVRDFNSWLQLILKENKDSTSNDNVQNYK